MAGELEQAFGGVYSSLSDELQRPLVNRWMARMKKEGALPQLPKGLVEPKIVTGIDGLGRASDLQKLDVLIQGIGQTFGPDALATHIDIGSYIKRRAAALGVEDDGLVRSKEEIEKIRKQQEQARMREKAAGPAVQAVGRLAEKSAEVQSQEPS